MTSLVAYPIARKGTEMEGKGKLVCSVQDYQERHVQSTAGKQIELLALYHSGVSHDINLQIFVIRSISTTQDLLQALQIPWHKTKPMAQWRITRSVGSAHPVIGSASIWFPALISNAAIVLANAT